MRVAPAPRGPDERLPGSGPITSPTLGLVVMVVLGVAPFVVGGFLLYRARQRARAETPVA